MTVLSTNVDDTQFPEFVRLIDGGDGTDLNRGDRAQGMIGTELGPLNEPIDDLIYRTNYLFARVAKHRKSEVLWTGLNIALGVGPVNLITVLKAFTPTSGSLAPFFDVATDKLKVYNENVKLFFKLVLKGSFSGGSNPRTVSLSFTGAVPDIITAGRSVDINPDYLTFVTFFSVDKGGFLATNGSTMQLSNSSGTFTITDVKLIAEQ